MLHGWSGARAARVAHALAWIGLLTPAALLIHAGLTGGLGANPIESVTHRTGKASLILLIASLSVTPLRSISGWNAVIRIRRPLGVAAFAYALAHLLTYVVLDYFFSWADILEDIVKRPFITSGFLAFVLLVPLAATSTRASMRRLGPAWHRLHRLAYAAAALAVLHFFWKVKADTREPLIWAAVLAVLLAMRFLFARRRRPRPQPH